MESYRDYMFDLVEEEIIDSKWLAQALIYWLSEEDAEEFCRVNDILFEEEDEDADN